ncbi:TKL protein kinase [Saprolegnia parasitica CBS 223.65]|uniref:TKL protein kinase n=1 Tax=Saprolegnia parasitica (strain CBS 223.65) TaxID=695850 RepID=A0A067C746_SAPPC|nr:TKL protein kinase [Saprolegnia parasitica CBS 223.65]KDO26318.1 TKL protein kinase [Saprolegnia parasitica CBS 223.65]|eukprot:XP_012203017.1 TKL protein kinase [Saprolegnia parasitica CBS 223.65]
MKTEVGHWLGRPVLLKSVDTTRSDDEQARMRQRLTAEIQSMARMDTQHVQFLGFYITPNRDVCCITEFAEGGTLRHLLDNRNVLERLTWGLEKIALAIDIASALAAMHALKPALIHRNVKASKVLLTSEKIAKLSGFGVAREKSFEYDMASGVSDLQWSAPELLLDGEDYNEQVDVYAFGVLLTELDTGAIPFATEMALMQKEELRAKITAGVIRPKLSSMCPLVIRNIVAQCLQQDPRLRPRSDKMLAMLQDAQIVLENEGGNDIP